MTSPAKSRLFIEMVPKSSHRLNLRTAGTSSQWKTIRTLTVHLAGGHCEICSATPTATHPLEAHEVWILDVATSTQVLERTIALCWLCHLAKHPGVAEKLGLVERMHRHVMHINAWSADDLVEHTKTCLREWVRLSAVRWRFEPDLPGIIAALKQRAKAAATSPT